jgi:hypothetical protein
VHLRLLGACAAAALVGDARTPDLGWLERQRERRRERQGSGDGPARLERLDRIVDGLDAVVGEPARASVGGPDELRHQ